MKDYSSFLEYLSRQLWKVMLPILIVVFVVMMRVYAARYFPYSDTAISVLDNIATAMIVATVLSVFYYYSSYEQSIALQQFSKEMTSRIMESTESVKSTSESGIYRIYENPSKLMAEYPSIIEDARVRIDIVGANLVPFFRITDSETPIANALKRRVSFRLLLLDPESKVAKLLSTREGRDETRLQEHLRDAVKFWLDFGRKSGRMEVRMYPDLPNLFLMIVDNRLFFAPYLRRQSIVSFPVFEVRGGRVFSAFEAYFDTIWMESTYIGS